LFSVCGAVVFVKRREMEERAIENDVRSGESEDVVVGVVVGVDGVEGEVETAAPQRVITGVGDFPTLVGLINNFWRCFRSAVK